MRTRRCVASLPSLRVFPPARDHVHSSTKQAPEKRDFGLGGGAHCDNSCRMNRLRRILLRPSPLQTLQPLADLRPLLVEGGQPALQRRDLLSDVIGAGDRLVPSSAELLAGTNPSSRIRGFLRGPLIVYQ
jgi:hypothetical protein